VFAPGKIFQASPKKTLAYSRGRRRRRQKRLIPFRRAVDDDSRRDGGRYDVRGRRRRRLSSHDVGPRDPARYRQRLLTYDSILW